MESTTTKQQQRSNVKKLSTVTEEELKKQEFITPEDVLRLTTYTKGNLYVVRVELSYRFFFPDYLYNGNAYDIEFVKYKIRDIDSGTVLLELGKPGTG